MAKVTPIGKVYPMDSKVSQGDDGLPVYDRAYNASDLRAVMSEYLTDGVFADSGDELAVTRSGDEWSVGTGRAMAGGLLVRVDAPCPVIEQSEIGTGQYAHIVLAARFDERYRDAAVYAVVSESTGYAPVRDASTHELVLARIDWRGGLVDRRLDNAACGIVQPFAELDTDSLLLELHTAVSQFNLNVGEVTSSPPGSTPTVAVRKPETAGGEVYIDFGIPRGAKGEPGEDGDAAPTMYVRPEGEEPPRVYGNAWLVDDGATHTITAVRCYEADRVHPGAATFPGAGLFPGGTGQWVDHKLSKSLFEE